MRLNQRVESTVLRLENISVHKHERSILKKVSLSLTEQRTGIIGSNGSGKSTLARVIKGLDRISEGNIYWDGQLLEFSSRGERASAVQSRVGFVFQNPDNQIVFPIVEEDMAFGLSRSGLSQQQIHERIGDQLARFGLESLRQRRIHELSGGEKQLIATMSVLVMEPELLVFDEPTTLLDYRNRMRWIQTLASLSQPAIIVSHDLDLMQIMDRVLVLEQGEVVFDSLPSQAIAHYKNLHTC